MTGARPPWLRLRLRHGPGHAEMRRILDAHGLHTVCEEAQCPNIHECYGARTATFLIMGAVCTRRCAFCAVKSGKPAPLDGDEPRRVAAAAAELRLRHAVVTSVDRDDLPDGGAAHFARTIDAIRAACPGCAIEVLTPDFKANPTHLDVVFARRPDVFAFNVETVGRLHPLVRPQVSYARSLDVLAAAAAAKPSRGFLVKSGFMVGLGENDTDIRATLQDLARTPCDIVTIGQYLAPTAAHHPVARFAAPDEFEAWRRLGEEQLGIPRVFAAPLVRSSYHAAAQVSPDGPS